MLALHFRVREHSTEIRGAGRWSGGKTRSNRTPGRGRADKAKRVTSRAQCWGDRACPSANHSGSHVGPHCMEIFSRVYPCRVYPCHGLTIPRSTSLVRWSDTRSRGIRMGKMTSADKRTVPLSRFTPPSRRSQLAPRVPSTRLPALHGSEVVLALVLSAAARRVWTSAHDRTAWTVPVAGVVYAGSLGIKPQISTQYMYLGCRLTVSYSQFPEG